MFINWTCLFNWRDTVGSSMLNMTRICALIWHQTKLLTTRRSAACWMIFRTSLSWQRGRQNKTIDETILDGAYIDIYTELCIYIYMYEICVYIHYSWKKWIACGLVVLWAVYLHLFSASDTTYIVLEPPSRLDMTPNLRCLFSACVVFCAFALRF